MKRSDIPTKFNIPFANSAGGGFIRPIPQASQIGVQSGAASLTDGFPPLNFLPAGAGGVPPFGQDMNGILNQVSAWSRWQVMGAAPLYDGTWATAVGGYAAGSTLSSLVYLGAVWQSLVDDNETNPDDPASTGWVFAARWRLSAATTFYVSTTGSDTTGLGTIGAPWQTIQKAANFVTSQVDMAGNSCTIQVANGVYTGFVCSGPLVGGVPVFRGDPTTPANCTISPSSVQPCINVQNGARIAVTGFKFLNASAGGSGLRVLQPGSAASFTLVEFAACAGQHIEVQLGGYVECVTSYTITGGALSHVYSYGNSLAQLSGTTCNLSGNPSFSGAFATVQAAATINIPSVSFGGTAVGNRYTATDNGVIYTGTNGAPTYLPGTIAGTTGRGGVYD